MVSRLQTQWSNLQAVHEPGCLPWFGASSYVLAEVIWVYNMVVGKKIHPSWQHPDICFGDQESQAKTAEEVEAEAAASCLSKV